MNTGNCDYLSSTGSVFCMLFNTEAETGLNHRALHPHRAFLFPAVPVLIIKSFAHWSVSKPAPTQEKVPVGYHPGYDAMGEGHEGQVNRGRTGGTPRDGSGIKVVCSAKGAGKGLPAIGEVDVGWKHHSFPTVLPPIAWTLLQESRKEATYTELSVQV